MYNVIIKSKYESTQSSLQRFGNIIEVSEGICDTIRLSTEQGCILIRLEVGEYIEVKEIIEVE